MGILRSSGDRSAQIRRTHEEQLRKKGIAPLPALSAFAKPKCRLCGRVFSSSRQYVRVGNDGSEYQCRKKNCNVLVQSEGKKKKTRKRKRRTAGATTRVTAPQRPKKALPKRKKGWFFGLF